MLPQEFMEVARQNLPMLSGLPAPLLQAINKNDPEELQRIFRSGAVHALLASHILHWQRHRDALPHDGCVIGC